MNFLMSIQKAFRIFLMKLLFLGKYFTENKLIRNIFGLITLIFCLVYLFNNAIPFSNLIELETINYWELFISNGYVLLAVMTGGIAWYLLITATNQAINVVEALKIHMFSNISKYIPLIGFQVIIKAFQLRRENINYKNIWSVIIIEFLLQIITGLAVGLFFYPWPLSSRGNVAIKVLSAFLLVVAPFLLRSPQLTRRLGFKLKIVPLLGAVMILVVNWNLLGLSIQYNVSAINSPQLLSLSAYTAIYAFAIIIGILIVPIPNGIGIRESALVFLFSTLAKDIPSAYIAGISRLQIAISELVAAAIIGVTYLFFKK